MEDLFLKIFNMSITASWIALAVILLRLPLKKAPKWVMGVLWAFVALRLIFPISLESVLSLIPSAQTLPQDFTYSPAPVINSGIPMVNSAINPVLFESLAPEPGASVNPTQVLSFVASVIWIIGMAGMLLYMLISYIVLKLKVRESVAVTKQYGSGTDDTVRICDRIPSPFILGVIFPRIYLPSNLGEEDMRYVMEHEKTHIKRGDHLWKPLGFLLLSVYWFNPILWAAYVLMCRDIELACDEKVIRSLGEDSKKAYSNALINCSAPRRLVSACPLAFGEVGVKERIKRVLNYKKPAFWIIILAIVSCAVVAVCFLTNPKKQVTTIASAFDNSEFSTIFTDATRAWLKKGDFDEDFLRGTGDVFHISSELLKDYVSEVESIKIDALTKPADISTIGSEPDYIIGINAEYDGGDRGRVVILCFNEDFTEFWTDPNGKPDKIFPVKEPEKVERLFSWIDNAEDVSGYEAFNNHTGNNEKEDSVVPIEASLFGRDYAAKDTIAQSLVLSSIQRPEFAPVLELYNSRYDSKAQNVIPAEGLALIFRDTGERRDLGDAEEITLTKENFDELFSTSMQWEGNIYPEYLRKNAEKVYSFSSDAEFYYVIKTKDGELYSLNGSIYRDGKEVTKTLLRGYRLADVTPYPISLGGYIDHAFYDVDHDGVQETCILSYGPTSGLYTIMFTFRQGDKYEYNTVFCPQFSYLRDPTDLEGGRTMYSNYRFGLKDGRLIVTAIEDSPANPEPLELEISLRDGGIVLTAEDGTEMQTWENGINPDAAGELNYAPIVDIQGNAAQDDEPVDDDSALELQGFMAEVPIAKVNTAADMSDISSWFDTSSGKMQPVRFSMPKYWQPGADGLSASQNGEQMMKIVAVYKAEEQPLVDELVAKLAKTPSESTLSIVDNSAESKRSYRFMIKVSEKDAGSSIPSERYYYFVERDYYCFCLRSDVNQYSDTELNESLFQYFYDSIGGALEPTEFEHVYIAQYSRLNSAKNGFEIVSEDDKVFITLNVPSDWNWNRGTADLDGSLMFNVGRIYPAAEDEGFEILKKGARDITELKSGDKYSYKLHKTIDGGDVLVYLLKRDGLCAELIFNVNEHFDEEKCERLVETFDMMDMNNTNSALTQNNYMPIDEAGFTSIAKSKLTLNTDGIFRQYTGGKTQRIPSAEYNPPASSGDIVFYRDGGEPLEDVIKAMEEEIIKPLAQPSQERPFTVTEYSIGKQEYIDSASWNDSVISALWEEFSSEGSLSHSAANAFIDARLGSAFLISEDMWILPYLNIYYSYTGSDLVTMQERLDSGETEVNGLLPLMRQGSDDVFCFVVARRDGVYALARAGGISREAE